VIGKKSLAIKVGLSVTVELSATCLTNPVVLREIWILAQSLKTSEGSISLISPNLCGSSITNQYRLKIVAALRG
jgi:hypothetical protein